jgi:dephospho-CoA kinase
MLVVGLLGGVASGKSLVARQFCELGAGLLDGDRAGHEVLLYPEIERQIREHFGEEVFGPQGRVDRKALGRIVFATSPDGRQALERLERITHPEIGALLRRQAEKLAAEGRKLAVLDAPVMLKAGWNEFCDHIVFVDAPRRIRLARAMERGWNQEDFAAREAAQESLEVKRAHADTIIDNSGPPEATQAQVKRLWDHLVG